MIHLRAAFGLLDRQADVTHRITSSALKTDDNGSNQILASAEQTDEATRIQSGNNEIEKNGARRRI